MAIKAGLPFNKLETLLEQRVDAILVVLFIGCFAWAMGKLVNLLKEVFLSRYHLNNPNNLRERKVRTQIQFIEKIVLLLLYVVAVSLILMNFESIRRIGGSLIASAGLAGVAIGFAAQKSLANLLAGFQIAFTQPIRIDDVVIVEGEWGRVEEITFTYVVVRIWDKRILIVPITYFLEKPFQNWTRTSADILATVFLHVDYSVPLAAVRKEFQKFVGSVPLWDGETALVQVTNASDRTVEIRLLMSARNGSDAFDLRCIIREHMITYIQGHFPQSLPQFRVSTQELESAKIERTEGLKVID
jgi:small-conductance mechanosensitive channel